MDNKLIRTLQETDLFAGPSQDDLEKRNLVKYPYRAEDILNLANQTPGFVARSFTTQTMRGSFTTQTMRTVEIAIYYKEHRGLYLIFEGDPKTNKCRFKHVCNLPDVAEDIEDFLSYITLFQQIVNFLKQLDKSNGQ